MSSKDCKSNEANIFRTSGLAIALFALVPVLLSGAIPAASANPLLVSRAFGVNVSGNGSSSGSDNNYISANGRYVAFHSYADNLVAGDRNNRGDVFLYDVLNDRTIAVSDVARANDDSLYPSISANGRYIAYESRANNLVPGDRNGMQDVFRYDAQTGQTIAVSDVAMANDDSFEPSISANGRYIVYESFANNLVSGDRNNRGDVFLYDVLNDRTIAVSNVARANGGRSRNPSISANGRYIAFESSADNQVPGDQNGLSDIFRYDALNGRMIAVTNLVRRFDDSTNPSISAAGGYIAFEVRQNNMMAKDVFLYDVLAGQTILVSKSDPLHHISSSPSISFGGRYMTYIYQNDVHAPGRILRYNILTRSTMEVSNIPMNVDSFAPSISTDGRIIAFSTGDDILNLGDNNNDYDVFRVDLGR